MKAMMGQLARSLGADPEAGPARTSLRHGHRRQSARMIEINP
jgi:hypothetical protein